MPYSEPPAPSQIMPGTYTLAQVMAVDPSLFPRKYAWVTDLFGGGTPDWCISDGAQWKPVRPQAVQNQTLAGAGTLTLTAMAMAPTQVLGGVIGGLGTNMVVSYSTLYAWKGAKFRTIRRATGLGGLLINGLGLGLNAWADNEFDGSTWVQTASGGLL